MQCKGLYDMSYNERNGRMTPTDKRSHMVKEFEMLEADLRALNPKTTTYKRLMARRNDLHEKLYGAL